jgi:hypothetical protein
MFVRVCFGFVVVKVVNLYLTFFTSLHVISRWFFYKIIFLYYGIYLSENGILVIVWMSFFCYLCLLSYVALI